MANSASSQAAVSSYARSYASSFVVDEVSDREVVSKLAEGGKATDSGSFFTDVPAHLEDCRAHLAEADKELERYFTMLKEELTLAAVKAIPATSRKAALHTQSAYSSHESSIEHCAAVVGSEDGAENSDDEDVTVQVDAQFTDLERQAQELMSRWNDMLQDKVVKETANADLTMRVKAYEKQERFVRNQAKEHEHGLEHKIEEKQHEAEELAHKAEGQVHELEDELASSKEEVSKLTSELSDARMQIRLLTTQVNSLHGRLYISESGVVEMREKVQLLEKARTSDGDGTNLEQKAEELKQARSHEKEKQEWETLHGSLRQQLASAVQAKERAQEELSALRDEKSELAKVIAESDNVIEDLQADRQHLVDAIDKQQSDYQALAQAGEELRVERDQLAVRIEELEAEAQVLQHYKAAAVATPDSHRAAVDERKEVPPPEAASSEIAESPFFIPWKRNLKPYSEVMAGDSLENLDANALDPQPSLFVRAAEVPISEAEAHELPPHYLLDAMRPALCHFNRSSGEISLKPLIFSGPARMIPVDAIRRLQRSTDYPTVVDIELDNLHLRLSTSDEEACEYLETLLGVRDRAVPGDEIPFPSPEDCVDDE